MNAQLRTIALTSFVALAPACGKKAPETPPAEASAKPAADEPAAPSGQVAGEPGSAAADPAGKPAQPEGCPAELSGTDNQDRTIRKACGTVKVSGSYEVNGATLTLEAGVKLAFAPGASLEVGYSSPAKLIVKGTADEPVVFESAGDQAAGVWRGVTLYDHADRSSLEGLVIAHAGREDGAALLLDSGVEDVRLAGLTFKDVRGAAIRVDAGAKPAEIAGCDFGGAGTPAAMVLGPNAVRTVKPGQTFGPDAYVRVEGGVLGGEHTWANPGAPYLITGTVEVQGQSGGQASLTLAAGTVIKMGADAAIEVGYAGPGKLVAVGAAEAPLVFTSGTEPTAGAWGGLRVYGSGTAKIQHARIEHAGGGSFDAALVVDGKASVQDVTFRDAQVGIKLEGTGAQLDAFERLTFERVPTAAALLASQLGQLGTGNRYDEGARIDVSAADVTKSVTWRAQAPAVVAFVDGEPTVQGGATVTVEAGSSFAMGEGVTLSAGYAGVGILVLKGTAEAPITFRGLRTDPGAWSGLRLYREARATVLEHVQFAHAGDAGAVQVDDGAEVTLQHVSCSECAGPTVVHGCTAKVTAAEVTAGAEGQVAVKKAEDCD